MSRITSAAFDDLNAEQRAAVEHGLEPLLVIAGAGSGKTKTLSCRVAHLVATGVDPSRILLLTFSRRAASEMIARVGKVMAGDVRIPWAGTFHAIGARLLRELAPVIGIDPEFTIHDRSDSADLMGMVRQELGVATGAKRFPMKGTCLAIYSRVVNADEIDRRCAGRRVSVVPRMGSGAEAAVRGVCRSEAEAERAWIMTICFGFGLRR